MHSHRPFEGHGGTVVIDDTDRIWSETWIGIGNTSRANALRHSNKLRLNHPLQVMFAPAAAVHGSAQVQSTHEQQTGPPHHPVPRVALRDPLGTAVAGLASSVHLQNVRATSSTRDELLVSLLHVYQGDELPASASRPASVDLPMLLRPFRPDLSQYVETTLNGLLPKANLSRLAWNTTRAAIDKPRPARGSALGQLAAGLISIDPFEWKAFIVH
jgi:hypothetical protein